MSSSTSRPPRLARIVRQGFGPGKPFTEDEKVYFRDLLDSYGLPCPEERFANGRNTFTEMVEQLTTLLGPVDEPFELALLAHATPDAQPGSPMSYLTTVVPISGVAFAVSDQGAVSPFTALRLLARHRRTLLIIIDQTALVHDQPVPDVVRPLRDYAIALVFDDTGRIATVDAELQTAVAPQDIPAALAGVDPAMPVLRGAGITPYWTPSGTDVVTVPQGLPCTGLWSSLADMVPQWQGRRVLLADYDLSLGYLAFCTVDISARS